MQVRFLSTAPCKTAGTITFQRFSLIQAFILFGIAEGTFKNISSLSKELGLNQGNVSTMCKGMEKEGLIKRIRSNEDERVVTLSLTDQGKKTIEKLYSKSEIFDDVFKDVPIEKLQAIINGFHELDELLKTISK